MSYQPFKLLPTTNKVTVPQKQGPLTGTCVEFDGKLSVHLQQLLLSHLGGRIPANFFGAAALKTKTGLVKTSAHVFLFFKQEKCTCECVYYITIYTIQ